MLPRRRAVLVLALCLLATACGELPRDPEGALGRVRGGRLRVGLVEHPPWVVRTEGEPSGAEVELVRRLAAELNARPEWHWGGEQRQMEALERFELDLVVGGITKSTPWSKYVGLTGPYFEETYAVGFPGSPTPPKSLKGVEVAVRGGDPAAYYLSKEGATVSRVSSLTPVSGPVAAPTWELDGLGLVASDKELHTEKHVWAVPPGENGWIKRLEEFLSRERPQVKGLLQKESAR
ncbi:MAG TPA: transporter substrate-binding domain-containing protein [Pyrinomonadaceae bacterium]|nr:transporter substrate-binding domain-containing protein [Pyrinomonadaceae bacterium]